jgi:UDP-N-acetylmuramate: L-alanyl-gamma-D-glutamyl-meso-diaminopimelate ligase
MKIHILGVCGTFMAGVALLAREAGHQVSGSDSAVYPPMSTQLQAAGLEIVEGYRADQLEVEPDQVVVGNVMTRTIPVIEALLDSDLDYTSGPQWLAQNVLRGRWVVAVAGTHGKTTTTAMLAWILDQAGLEPGFLIGGLPANFGSSARLGKGRFFVVEADEYDSAFFDKRSKFVHYRPRTLVLNNLEYDHADIFPNLASIRTQFHHLVRTIPETGLIVANGRDPEIARVLEMGCWTPVERFVNGDWQARELVADGSAFEIRHRGERQGLVEWRFNGAHNIHNALAAVAAARHVGVPAEVAIAALARFEGVRRRQELRGTIAGVSVYDDFAHHPTAIAGTLTGLRARVDRGRIVAVLELRSNTMRMGVHKDALVASLEAADRVHLLRPERMAWDLQAEFTDPRVSLYRTVGEIVAAVTMEARSGDLVVIMSNGGFGGIHELMLQALGEANAAGEPARG